ncbi:MAG TPA: UDP-N-acetylmuramoyl-tripeptide--D-alanyl-D-alanine ligase [bacterium]|nr:UDP-N-acetylmuramoyl-tripeptide--D-alanyl-D-alanine ligase [bacterium]
MRLTVGEILNAVGGRLVAGDPDEAATGVSTDSRALQAGDLFVALKGERHDGHQYLADVFAKGAAAAIVQEGAEEPNPDFRNLIEVRDTLTALGDLAHFWRRRFPIPVVAITGSNGKTTAKDMTAAVLAAAYRVLKTEGNFNNLIGLPLTLFRLRPEHEMAVVEMGMNRLGEIDRLAEIASPSVGVVTTVARAHLEGLGGLANVARAKGELIARLPEGGLAVLNADASGGGRFTPEFARAARRRGARAATFGLSPKADYRAIRVKAEGLKGVRFDARVVGKKWGKTAAFSLGVPGRHNVSNALAAIAVGDRFDVPVSKMRSALSRFHAGSKRMEIVRLAKGIDVVNDCYNANPDSTEASLHFLKELGPRRRRVAVLGEMLELGRWAASCHREVGGAAARSGVKLLFAVGPHAEDLVKGARRAGLAKSSSFSFGQVEESLPMIRSLLKAKDVVLVKGSRGMKMERVTEDLMGRGMARHAPTGGTT